MLPEQKWTMTTVNMHKNLVEFRHAGFEIQADKQRDKETNKQRDTLITILCTHPRNKVNIKHSLLALISTYDYDSSAIQEWQAWQKWKYFSMKFHINNGKWIDFGGNAVWKSLQ